MEEAWMASPTHRANILNEKYKEIGVAVKEGKINGHETILAVVMFGSGDKNSSDLTKTKKEIPQTGESWGREDKKIPSLPSGEKRKEGIVLQMPLITSPQMGEILSGKEISIIGRAKPGEIVEIFDNGILVALTTADLDGWFLAAEKNLSEGSHQLAVKKKDILSEYKTEFYVDWQKPGIDFHLWADEKDPHQFFVEAKTNKSNCTFQFNGETRKTAPGNRVVFSVKSNKSSAVLWVKDEAGNRNFRQINLANYYSPDYKNNMTEKLTEMFFSPRNIFALNSGREAMKRNLGLTSPQFAAVQTEGEINIMRK
jgi:hypothetical protein